MPVYPDALRMRRHPGATRCLIVRNTGWLTNMVKPAHRKIPSSDNWDLTLPRVLGADFAVRFQPVLFWGSWPVCAFQPDTVGNLSHFFPINTSLEVRAGGRCGGSAGRLLDGSGYAPMGLGLNSVNGRN